MCIYIYIYTLIYIYIYMCLYIHISIHAHITLSCCVTSTSLCSSRYGLILMWLDSQSRQLAACKCLSFLSTAAVEQRLYLIKVPRALMS